MVNNTNNPKVVEEITGQDNKFNVVVDVLDVIEPQKQTFFSRVANWMPSKSTVAKQLAIAGLTSLAGVGALHYGAASFRVAMNTPGLMQGLAGYLVKIGAASTKVVTEVNGLTATNMLYAYMTNNFKGKLAIGALGFLKGFGAGTIAAPVVNKVTSMFESEEYAELSDKLKRFYKEHDVARVMVGEKVVYMFTSKSTRSELGKTEFAKKVEEGKLSMHETTVTVNGKQVNVALNKEFYENAVAQGINLSELLAHPIALADKKLPTREVAKDLEPQAKVLSNFTSLVTEKVNENHLAKEVEKEPGVVEHEGGMRAALDNLCASYRGTDPLVKTSDFENGLNNLVLSYRGR